MSRKVKVLISALVVAVLLTMGGITMVMAEGEEETTPPPKATAKGLLERVADILEIDKEALIDAFKQAQQEMMGDAFINRLNQAVKEERITREQADEIIRWWGQRPYDPIREWWGQRPDDAIREWWGLKPEVIKPGMVERALRFRAMPRVHMRNSLRGWFCPRLSG